LQAWGHDEIRVIPASPRLEALPNHPFPAITVLKLAAFFADSATSEQARFDSAARPRREI